MLDEPRPKFDSAPPARVTRAPEYLLPCLIAVAATLLVMSAVAGVSGAAQSNRTPPPSESPTLGAPATWVMPSPPSAYRNPPASRAATPTARPATRGYGCDAALAYLRSHAA